LRGRRGDGPGPERSGLFGPSPGEHAH
jgi:hypothetical protein